MYVYLIYGMYPMLNIVTGEKEYPAAVLIRGAGPYDGPGKLTKALNITLEYNGEKLGRTIGIWIERPKKKQVVKVQATPRIGVGYAGVWAEKRLRFVQK
jgi:DNA-3-methyladenine glycosylase